MNAKFSFVLLVAIIALLVTACAPTTGVSAPIDPALLAENETVSQVPVTGASAAESVRTETEPRLWSGEIFFSDTGNPDVQLKVQTDNQPDLEQTGCMSEDDQPRQISGCVE